MLHQKISPMLSYPSDPFDSAYHIFEIKWDGTRCLLFADQNGIRLQNRRLIDISFRYPEITDLRRNIKAQNAILDGELVVSSGGKPDFYKLQKRIHLRKPELIKYYSTRIPATYIVFDILYQNGESLLDVPLYRRKEILEKVVEPVPSLIVSQPFWEKVTKLFSEACRYEPEGIVAKECNSHYLIGKRSRNWLKMKVKHEATCFIVGLKMKTGCWGDQIAALILADSDGDKLKYCGHVGSGLSAANINKIWQRISSIISKDPAISNTTARLNGMRWIKPELKCRVIYNERTAHGHLRAPVFQCLLD